MEFIIPDYVSKTLSMLEHAGFEAFIVGGCLRDLILGKLPSDYDVATSANPDEIQDVFKDLKMILVGKQFGTIVVVHQEGNIEVTTYRTEGEYKDGRRPSNVTFTTNIYEDLSRRDLTINSIAYNKKNGIVDPFNGMQDIKNGIIRAVGNPYDRFNEDHLRIIRSVRFSTQLNFRIEKETYNACKELSSKIDSVSYERIRDELFKILLSDIPSNGIRIMERLGLLEVIIPELLFTIDFNQQNPNHDRTVFEHILCVLDNTPPVLTIRVAALLHDIAKPITFSIDEKGIGHFYGHDKKGAELSREILTRLRCSREFTNRVIILVSEHMHHASIKEKGIKRQLKRVGEDNIFDLIELKKADMKCKSGNKDMSKLLYYENLIRELIKNKVPYEKKHLNIDGNDIIDLGFEPGKGIGEILDYLMEKVLENPELNERDTLIEIIRKHKI